MSNMTIIFDVDDTLYDQLKPFYMACKQVIYNLSNLSINQLFVASRKYSDQMFKLTELGVINIEEMHQYRLIKAFEEQHFKINQQQAAMIQKAYLEHQNKITLLPTIVEVLNYASKKGIGLGVITNGPASHQRMKIKQLQLCRWIDEFNILISEEIGFAKPDPRIFKLLEKRMGMIPEKTYYIGDSFQNDVIGSKLAGWKSIWLNHRNRKNTNDYRPDFTIQDIKQLLPTVRSIYKLI